VPARSDDKRGDVELGQRGWRVTVATTRGLQLMQLHELGDSLLILPVCTSSNVTSGRDRPASTHNQTHPP
jgi:hypothetical protein